METKEIWPGRRTPKSKRIYQKPKVPQIREQIKESTSKRENIGTVWLSLSTVCRRGLITVRSTAAAVHKTCQHIQGVVTQYPPVESTATGIKMTSCRSCTDTHGNVVACTNVYGMCTELSRIKRK